MKKTEIANKEGPERLAHSIKETSTLLNYSEKSVRRLITRGLLRANRSLRVIRISRDEIERFAKIQ